jgi:hypothetical protein
MDSLKLLFSNPVVLWVIITFLVAALIGVSVPLGVAAEAGAAPPPPPTVAPLQTSSTILVVLWVLLGVFYLASYVFRGSVDYSSTSHYYKHITLHMAFLVALSSATTMAVIKLNSVPPQAAAAT